MTGRRIWEIGGFISGVVLIVFGVVALYMGINGYQTVGDELGKEQIVGGSDMAPAEIQKAASEAGLPATIAADLRCRRRDHRHRQRGALLRAVHAHPRARGIRRIDLCADGAFPVGCGARRSSGYERRSGRREG